MADKFLLTVQDADGNEYDVEAPEGYVPDGGAADPATSRLLSDRLDRVPAENQAAYLESEAEVNRLRGLEKEAVDYSNNSFKQGVGGTIDTLSELAGGVAGGVAGGAAGVPTGPGAIATSALGGAVGAAGGRLAGDQINDALGIRPADPDPMSEQLLDEAKVVPQDAALGFGIGMAGKALAGPGGKAISQWWNRKKIANLSEDRALPNILNMNRKDVASAVPEVEEAAKKTGDLLESGVLDFSPVGDANPMELAAGNITSRLKAIRAQKEGILDAAQGMAELPKQVRTGEAARGFDITLPTQDAWYQRFLKNNVPVDQESATGGVSLNARQLDTFRKAIDDELEVLGGYKPINPGNDQALAKVKLDTENLKALRNYTVEQRNSLIGEDALPALQTLDKQSSALQTYEPPVLEFMGDLGAAQGFGRANALAPNLQAPKTSIGALIQAGKEMIGGDRFKQRQIFNQSRDAFGQIQDVARVRRGMPLGAEMDPTRAQVYQNVARMSAAARGGREMGGPSMFPADPSEVMQADPFADGLPRTTDRFDEVALQRFVETSAVDPVKAPVARVLAEKMVEATRAGDSMKRERLLGDAAKLFPDLFEAGKGVNGKLFHKDDQKEYVGKMETAVRRGKVGPELMGAQLNQFADIDDPKILDPIPYLEQKVGFSQGQVNLRPNIEQGEVAEPRRYGY